MASSVQYIVDDQGRKKSVLIPINVWEELNAEYSLLKEKYKIVSGIREGLNEVSVSRAASKKLQTLKSFLK
jgi:hypothetical protein